MDFYFNRRYGVKYMTLSEYREFVDRVYAVVGRAGVLFRSRSDMRKDTKKGLDKENRIVDNQEEHVD